ncbi:MAG: hypothetical protein V9H26_03770 [Verrucomicrobiota bacterium]
MFTRQRGQGQTALARVSTRCTTIPQCEQNFAPRKIIPKHDGHATVASRELQCSHRVASEEAAAPQLGQFNDWAAMGEILDAASYSASSECGKPITQFARNYASQLCGAEQ